MANGPNVGFSTLSVIPSTRGFSSHMRSQLSGVMPRAGREAGTAAGTSFTGAIGNAVSGVAGAIGRTLFGAAQATGLAAGGILATSFTKGLGRLVGIEEAQAKLRGLGHDASAIDEIMSNALESVLGTAFGLDEAATLAATAVASGVEPGEALERQLKLIGDAATIAGTGLGEMGEIFGIVQSGGRLMTRELNRMTQRGIPLLQWLADEFGVTGEEMREMVTQGAVDAETFRRVIEDNIGGAALESGKTTRGAFRNMGAAMGRFGATVLRPLFEQARNLFSGITVIFDEMEGRVGEVMDRFAESEGFQRFSEFLENLPDLAIEGFSQLRRFGRFLAPIGAALAAFASQGVAGLLRPLGLVLPVLNPLVAAFAALALTLPPVRDFLRGVGSAISEVVAGFRGADGPLTRFRELGGHIRDIWQAVKDLFAGPMKRAADDLAEVFGPLMEDLRGFIGLDEIENPFAGLEGVPDLIGRLGELVTDLTGFMRENDDETRAAGVGLGTFLAGLLTLRGLGSVAGVAGRIGTAIAGVGRGVIGIAGGPIGIAVAAISGLVAGIIYLWNNSEGFRDAVGPIWEEVQGAIEPVVSWATNVAWPALQEAFGGIVDTAVELGGAMGRAWSGIQATVGPVVSWFATHVSPVIAAVVGGIIEVVGLMFDIWLTTWRVMGAVLGPFIRIITDVIGGFLGWLAPIWEEVWAGVVAFVEDHFGPFVGWIEDRLSDIQSFFEGAREGVATIREIFTDIAGVIEEKIDEGAAFVEALPGRIKGFFEDAGTLLFDIGADIIGGLWDGMRSIWEGVGDWLSDLGGRITDLKGPAHVDKRLLRPIGGLIFEGLRLGMQEEWAEIEKWLRTVAPDISRNFEPIALPDSTVSVFDDPDTRDSFDPGGPRPGAGGLTIERLEVNNPIGEPTEESLASTPLAFAVSRYTRIGR